MVFLCASFHFDKFQLNDSLLAYVNLFIICMGNILHNATCFTGDAFQHFCMTNSITHKRSPPYHPASNGLAEQAVQTFKSVMQKATGLLEIWLVTFLFQNRNMPHCTTVISSAVLLKKQPLKGCLDLL